VLQPLAHGVHVLAQQCINLLRIDAFARFDAFDESADSHSLHPQQRGVRSLGPFRRPLELPGPRLQLRDLLARPGLSNRSFSEGPDSQRQAQSPGGAQRTEEAFHDVLPFGSRTAPPTAWSLVSIDAAFCSELSRDVRAIHFVICRLETPTSLRVGGTVCPLLTKARGFAVMD